MSAEKATQKPAKRSAANGTTVEGWADALATRRTILTELAEPDSMFVISHFASPGRIERAGSGLRLVAVA